MEITVKFGYRLYIFYSQSDVTEARSIYDHHTGTLDQFEDALEDAGIDFTYDMLGL